MRKTATMLRCVPRFGYSNTEVREIELDVSRHAEEDEIREAVRQWFDGRGISEAVYDIAVDDDGYFAVINDEAFDRQWGTPIF